MIRIRASHQGDGDGSSGILPLKGIIDALLDVEVSVGDGGLSESVSHEGANGSERKLHFGDVDERLRPYRVVRDC